MDVCNILITVALSIHCAFPLSLTNRVHAYVAKAGYRPNTEAIEAIIKASETYQVNPIQLARIAILESSFNPRQKPHMSPDGTFDYGMFQINEVNRDSTCKEFNIYSLEGNSMCAAKIVSNLRKIWSDKDDYWIARYNSRNPVAKAKYWKRYVNL